MQNIKLKRAKNYRDLGGAPTKDGRTLKYKMLLRGKSLFKMKASNILILKNEYNLHTVIDLRTIQERNEKPNKIVQGVTILDRPLHDDAIYGISRERSSKDFHTIKTLKEMAPLDVIYKTLVEGESLRRVTSLLKEILTFPAENYAVLFHCSEGKDRTGVIAALLLLFLGVSRDYVLEDYLYTNKSTAFKAKMVKIVLFLLKHDRKLSEKISMYYKADQRYLDSALGKLEKKYGSIQNYFDTELKFTPQEVAELKNKFLE